MCVMSMVYDHYKGSFPWINPDPFSTDRIPSPVHIEEVPKIVLKDLKKKVEEFEKAKAAAEVVDTLTDQKDCVDPEKQKLDELIKHLKDVIANPPEFVLVEGKNLEPGTYRIVGGVLYKVV